MEYNFSDEDIKNGINEIYIEDDDVKLSCSTLIKLDKGYMLRGSALIENEVYHDFEVIFSLIDEPYGFDPYKIMESQWDWYDYNY